MLNSNSLYSRTRVLVLPAEAMWVLLLMTMLIVLFTAHIAKAETTRHTRTTTTTTIDSDDDGTVDAPPVNAAVPPPPPVAPAPRAPYFIESQMSQTFGSKAVTGMAGCKTEALSKDVIKDLKRECATWVAEQKKDLGQNYLGNTCEDSCEACDMNLVRCKVTGTIRYKKIDN